MSDIDAIVAAINPKLDQINKTGEILERVEQASLDITQERIAEFLALINSTDTAALDVVIEELIKIQEKNGTIQHALQHLADTLSPDLEQKNDITSYRTAIENIDRYGVIIPTKEQIKNANRLRRQKTAFSLLFQSLLKFCILKISQYLSKEEEVKNVDS